MPLSVLNSRQSWAMASTSLRMLRLLSLLQTRRYWPGEELARQLRVSPRTLRRDIDRLRDWGIPEQDLPAHRPHQARLELLDR